ncbi:MAG: PIG-L family deacetylase [Chloroflexi bacterium]|nr:PIG-L family deacetylase [Chloroflexota bacterium]
MHLFLSPHFDDVVLSCGGTVHQLTQRGEPVTVRTVLGQKPNPRRIPDTPIVRELHARWGQGDEAVAARIEEDDAAVKSLGATPQHMTVWGDCVYRVSKDGRPLYPSEGSLFGDIHPDDLAGRLIPTIVLPPREAVHALYAPLGAGHHVDHQIVRNWALELRKQNPLLALKFYEEYPYSEHKNAVDRALLYFQENGVKLEVEAISLSDADVEAKIRAIALYRSQISTFWDSAEAMAQAVRQHLLRIGSGTPVERFWRALPQ